MSAAKILRFFTSGWHPGSNAISLGELYRVLKSASLS